MTCTHVLGLIDAGPFAGVPRRQLEAAWEHASTCPTCGPALDASAALAADLAELTSPLPLRDMTAFLLARIDEIDEIERRQAAPQPGSPIREWASWAAVSAGMTITFGVALSLWSWNSVVTVGRASLQVPAEAPTAVLALGLAGLMLYVTGLLASPGFSRRFGTE